MQKRGKFDYILLETTGLADPGPIASIFWLDEELCSDVYLDGESSVIQFTLYSTFYSQYSRHFTLYSIHFIYTWLFVDLAYNMFLSHIITIAYLLGLSLSQASLGNDLTG